MTSDLYQGIADALTDAFAETAGTFAWHGITYGCVLNVENAVVITSKQFFPNGKYPQPGDVIQIVGKDNIVLSLSNADQILVPGGTVEPNVPFADDPMVPTLAIHYAALVRG